MSGREGCLRVRKGAWLAGAGWGGGGAGRGRGRPREATAPARARQFPTPRPRRGDRLSRGRAGGAREGDASAAFGRTKVERGGRRTGRTRQTATSSAAGFFGSAGGGSPGSFVGSGCSFWRAMARGGRACVRTAGLEGVAMRATFVNLFGPGSDARGREPRIQGRAVDRRRSREKFEGRQNFEPKNLGLNRGQTRVKPAR